MALDRLHLRHGVGRAILINSGNANACTGRPGMAAAATHCGGRRTNIGDSHSRSLHRLDRSHRTPASGGPHRQGAPRLFERLSSLGGLSAARAILTTDLKPKSVARRARINGRTVIIGGMAKGSGMIHPAMATMLGYLTTDAAITVPPCNRR